MFDLGSEGPAPSDDAGRGAALAGAEDARRLGAVPYIADVQPDQTNQAAASWFCSNAANERGSG